MRSPIHSAFTYMACAFALISQMIASPFAYADPTPGSSAWVDNDTARVRLLSHQTGIDKSTVLIGVQIELMQGWKTYWRNPGDSGIPPNFDWSGSKNLQSAKVLWPAPQRYDLSGEMTFAYKNDVIFPVEVTLSDPAKPLHVALDLFYGICEDMCVPVQANLSLALEPTPNAKASLFSAAIDRSVASVPKPAKAAGFTVHAEPMAQPVQAVTNAKGKLRYVELRIEGKEARRLSQVILEETTGTYFHQPVRMGGSENMNCFQIAYEVARSKDREALPVHLTAWGEDGVAIYTDLVLP